MPCEPFFNRGKMVGFMCSRGRGKPKPPPCYKCGKPSTKLCDHRAMEPIYGTLNGRRILKKWVPRLNTCDRPMCDACANHVEPDTDYCDFHNTEIARAESAKAEALHQERLRKMGMDDDL